MEENEIEKDNETMCVKYKKVTLKKKNVIQQTVCMYGLAVFSPDWPPAIATNV